jgi:glycine cleavage system protein P-like pyridoxal-binding family
MKTFFQIRELTGRMPKGKHVFDKKIKGVTVMVHKDQGRYVTYVDGDRLDAYRTQKEAEKAGLEFVKVVKK